MISTYPQTNLNFPEKPFWKIQGATSESEYWAAIAEMKTNFPSVADYLSEIDRTRWVLYAQVQAGATTFGWRTSNQAEIGQSMLKKLRGYHPLNFFEEFGIYVAVAIADGMKDFIKWRVQSSHGIVPFAIVRAKEQAQLGGNCQTRDIGQDQYQVQFVDPYSHGEHEVRVVDVRQKTCSCLEWQVYRLPCRHAFAAYQSRGLSWETVMTVDSVGDYTENPSTLHKSYRIPNESVSPLCAPSDALSPT